MAGGPSARAHEVTSAFVERNYQEHGRTVFQLCLRLGRGDTAWAEDIAHEVFVRLLEHAGELDREANIAGWLRTVAYRLCLDRLRRERSIWSRVQAALGAEVGLPSRSPEVELALSERAKQAQTALDSLPPKERAAMVMLHLDGMSQIAIAEVLGHSEGYVSKLIARATRTLRALGHEVGDD